MWLYTTCGFFSVVEDRQEPDRLVVRARVRGDLDNLREQYLPELGPTIDTPERDYQHRAYVGREDFARGLAALAMDLHQNNFKESVAARRATHGP